MKWYYARGDMQRGPVSEKELRELIDDGIIKPETRVWREGMSDWLPFSKVADLVTPVELNSTPSPPLPPTPSLDGSSASKAFQTSTHSESYSFNGKEYKSLEEMPAEARSFFQNMDMDHFGHGFNDHIEHKFDGTSTTHYEYNGKEYDSFEEMPPEAQEIFRDKDNNGIPDIFES